MRRFAVVTLVVGVVAAGGVAALVAVGEDSAEQAAVEACAEAQGVDLDRLRESPTVAQRGHPGFPTANLNVLLLPEKAGSSRCYFKEAPDGSVTLLGSSSD